MSTILPFAVKGVVSGVIIGIAIYFVLRRKNNGTDAEK